MPDGGKAVVQENMQHTKFVVVFGAVVGIVDPSIHKGAREKTFRSSESLLLVCV